MRRYARLDGDLVAELIEVPSDGPPLAERYHPDVVARCVDVPAGQSVEVGWSVVDGTFAPPPPPAAPPPIRAIAPFAFRQRLPAATRRAITLAASRALEAGDAALQTWLDDLSSARTVQLDHPDVAAGVAMLHAAGLITEAQATALLADGTPEET